MKKLLIAGIVSVAIAGVLFIFAVTNPGKSEQPSTETLVTPTQKPVTSADNAPSGSIHNLPVPTPVAAARKAASEFLGIPEGEAIIMTAFEKEWPDSCLGLPEKDEMCAQVVTSGYEVTVQGNGKEAIYRTNDDGSVMRVQK